MLKPILTSAALCFYYWWWYAESPFLLINNWHWEKSSSLTVFHYIYRAEWKNENDITVGLCNVSVYTRSNSPLILVCTKLLLYQDTPKIYLWKGKQSHSPPCWLYYALPAILVLTLQGRYCSLHVITMWSQKIHICQNNCAPKWCAKWMWSMGVAFKN